MGIGEKFREASSVLEDAECESLLSRQAYIKAITAVLERHAANMKESDRFPTVIAGLSIIRSTCSVRPVYDASMSKIYMTFQGDEWMMIGDTRQELKTGQAIILSVEEPFSCAVPVASSAHPRLALLIKLDRPCTQQVIEEIGIPFEQIRAQKKSRPCVFDLSSQLLDCVLRAVRLLDTPAAIPMLYPGIKREICYWLLAGPACEQLVEFALTHGHDERVLQAVQHLQSKFSESIRVEQLASAAGMSSATFHRQFKSVTSMSPMQYQKQLRLLEARRLMITSNYNVENVAVEVGYVSASQFSREYARMFGRPPRRDMSTCKSPSHAAPNVA